MSQAKVDRYKEEKANRKKNMKKEKVMNFFRKIMIGIAGLALIGGIGYSAYDTYEASRGKEQVEIDYTAFTDFQQDLASAAAAEQAQ